MSPFSRGTPRHDEIPPELAQMIYRKSRQLAKRGLGGIRIARELSGTYSLDISPGTIDHWIHGDRKPRLKNIFKEVPSPALSYIIGANKGDGSALTRSGCVKLEVTDRDFAEAFNRRMAELFSRKKPNRITVRMFRGERLPLYIVRYSSPQLVRLLHLPLARLLTIASVFPRDFLRGFFDAEGHVDVTAGKSFHLQMGADNTNLGLLLVVRRLLNDTIRIYSRIEQKRVAGTVKTIRGVDFVMRRTSYSLLTAGVGGMRRFSREIGFSIKRKLNKLNDALRIIAHYKVSKRLVAWERLYVKEHGEWVRRGF